MRTGLSVRAALAAAALPLLVVACGNGGEDRTLPDGTQTPEVQEPCVLEGAAVETQVRDSGVSFQPVVDVRWSDEGCPRIVFEFNGQVSDYEIGYAQGPFADCASAEPVDTEAWGAGAFLSVRLEPSASVDMTREYEETYTGSRDVSVSGPTLKHLKVTCDFEGVFEWLVGVEAERPFLVVTFSDPPRIVIDVSEEAA